MKRFLFSFPLFLILVMLVAACGGGAETTDDAEPAEQSTDSTSTDSEESDSEEVMEEDEIVIQHWYHQYGEEGTFEAVQRYAEEYSAMTPGVRVEVTWVPGDYFAALNSALLTDEGPDVFELQTVTLDRIEAGQLEPLDDLFEGVLDDFNQTAMQRVIIDDTIYGVPMIMDPQFVYYRKSMFGDAGVDVPQTMEELIAATQALDTGRVKGLYLSNDLGATSYLLYMSTWAANSDFIDGDAIIFNTPENVQMWERKRELVETDSMLVGATTEWWDPGAFNDGLTAMQWCGLWAMPGIIDAVGADDVGVMPWPALDENASPSVWIGGWNQSVNAKSNHVDAAKDYVRWLWIENAETQIDWNLGYGFHVPPRASIAAQADVLQDGPAAEVLEMLPLYGKTTPVTWTGAMDSIYQDAHSEVLLNDADPAEQLAAAAEAAQAELDALLNK
ncbi:ABC transporter substrate-binding protein [Candidatus Leptofilum sp.]|uniref:ABC transporter substrate-binding protein n=1 Tax=Candidatus Leptofilum sp. TaxID=3241576 RepID=UPI003B5B0257